jgi:hypothetical protein
VACLKPLLDEDKIIVFLVLQFFCWSIFELFVEMNDESLKQHILLLEVSILRHGVRLVGLYILLLEGRVFYKVNIPILKKEILFGAVARHQCLIIEINSIILAVQDIT